MLSEKSKPQKVTHWMILYNILEMTKLQRWKQIGGCHGTEQGWKGFIYKRVVGGSSFVVLKEFYALIVVVVT